MKTIYQVVEYRGSDIEYSVFQGTHDECIQWLTDHCHEDVELMGDTCWVNNDPTCKNGNGFAWKYSICEVE